MNDFTACCRPFWFHVHHLFGGKCSNSSGQQFRSTLTVLNSVSPLLETTNWVRPESNMIACPGLQRYKQITVRIGLTLPQRLRTLRAISDHWSFEDVQVIEEVCIVHILIVLLFTCKKFFKCNFLMACSLIFNRGPCLEVVLVLWPSCSLWSANTCLT